MWTNSGRGKAMNRIVRSEEEMKKCVIAVTEFLNAVGHYNVCEFLSIMGMTFDAYQAKHGMTVEASKAMMEALCEVHALVNDELGGLKNADCV